MFLLLFIALVWLFFLFLFYVCLPVSSSLGRKKTPFVFVHTLTQKLAVFIHSLTCRYVLFMFQGSPAVTTQWSWHERWDNVCNLPKSNRLHSQLWQGAQSLRGAAWWQGQLDLVMSLLQTLENDTVSLDMWNKGNWQGFLCMCETKEIDRQWNMEGFSESLWDQEN